MSKRMTDERLEELRVFVENRQGFYIGTQDRAGTELAAEAQRAREIETAALDHLQEAVAIAQSGDDVWLGYSWTAAVIDLLKKAGRR